MNSAVIPLACRSDLLLSPLPGGGQRRYSLNNLRTGDCYTLGGHEYFLLGLLDGGQTASDLCRAFQERFGEGLSESELHKFVELARARGFLEPVAAPEPEPAAGRDTDPLRDSEGAAAPGVSCHYDEVPYASRPFPQTHPDNLATVATLFGMQPPPVERCRVLELGCAAGGNLIPLAVTIPQGHFVGIDLSGLQIEDGRRMVRALALRNIELRRLSILDVDDGLGEFDYIVCHGVFSWVPAPVRDRILAVCARHLAPNGVAYVSYNTYPGWHLPGVVRAMMRFHADRFAEPAVRVRQARAVLEFLSAATPENDGYGGGLHKEQQLLRKVPDHYLFHEYLAEVNTPFYFHEFNALAEGHALQYLGEAAFMEMLTDNLDPGVAKTLRLLAPDLVQTEQYMDFLRNRRFRQTLLCRRGVPLDRTPAPERLELLYVSSTFRPVSANPDLSRGVVEEFRSPRGMPVTSGDPVVKAALLHLAEAWPAAVPFRDLPAAALARLGHEAGPDPSADAPLPRLLLASLLKCAAPGAVEFRLTPPRLVVGVSERPRATALARLQAATEVPVVSLRHEVVPLDALECRLLRHLDGRHDRGQLLQALADSTDPGLSAESLEQSLGRLARHALLEG